MRALLRLGTTLLLRSDRVHVWVHQVPRVAAPQPLPASVAVAPIATTPVVRAVPTQRLPVPATLVVASSAMADRACAVPSRERVVPATARVAPARSEDSACARPAQQKPAPYRPLLAPAPRQQPAVPSVRFYHLQVHTLQWPSSKPVTALSMHRSFPTSAT